MMPEMDGIALLREARRLDPNLVGVLMTGAGTIARAVEANESRRAPILFSSHLIQVSFCRC
jgi:DNA-binding NtrC family response regulator